MEDLQKKIQGTGLQGYVRTTYHRLVQEFGEPNFMWDDPYKVDAEWVLDTPFGVVTIYNYKDGKAYLGDKGLDVQMITDWHIGGKNKRVVSWVTKRLARSVSRYEVKVLGALGWDFEYYENFDDVASRVVELEDSEEEYKVYVKMSDGTKNKINFEVGK